MKYLSNYVEDAQTDLFDEMGAFFAFSNEQFNEQKKEGVQYVNLKHGLICDKKNVGALIDGLDNIQALGIKKDIAENGIKGIIHRELGNYECQISMCIDDALGALSGYGVTAEQVQAEYKEFFQICVDNDYF